MAITGIIRIPPTFQRAHWKWEAWMGCAKSGASRRIQNEASVLVI